MNGVISKHTTDCVMYTDYSSSSVSATQTFTASANQSGFPYTQYK